MDEAVKRAQTWLNDTYNGKKAIVRSLLTELSAQAR